MMVMLNLLNNPVLTLQLGILWILLGLMGRIVKGCVREVYKHGTGKLYVYVALPTPVGVWSMALGLRQRIYYYYQLQISFTLNDREQ